MSVLVRNDVVLNSPVAFRLMMGRDGTCVRVRKVAQYKGK
jgi:hypothetical protein